ncbi:MAG: peptidase M23 [Micropruina sp.]|uniref:CIS tube protein n=1 Tax=Micropruina sp. TaxID=2737536 RepID=UPI0039E4B004
MPGPIALQTSAAMAEVTPPGDKGAAGGAPVKGRPRMHKAQLSIYDPGAGGSAGALRGAVPFQFNPKEVTISKAAKWERKPAKGAAKAGPPEFNGAEPAKMTLEMFFDATAAQDGSVVKAVEALMSCLVPTPESLSTKKPSPPLVVLHWGSTASFPAFITSVSAKLTLFSADGTPIRAVCAVQLEEMPGEAFRKQNPTSGSYDVRRVHRTVAGDTLASVAFAEYGDPAAWRPLAAFNGIDDPLRVPSGTVLLLPAPEELAQSQGVR